MNQSIVSRSWAVRLAESPVASSKEDIRDAIRLLAAESCSRQVFFAIRAASSCCVSMAPPAPPERPGFPASPVSVPIPETAPKSASEEDAVLPAPAWPANIPSSSCASSEDN